MTATSLIVLLVSHVVGGETSRIEATSASVSGRRTLPGLPITIDRGGMIIRSVTSVPAATMQSSPI